MGSTLGVLDTCISLLLCVSLCRFSNLYLKCHTLFLITMCVVVCCMMLLYVCVCMSVWLLLYLNFWSYFLLGLIIIMLFLPDGSCIILIFLSFESTFYFLFFFFLFFFLLIFRHWLSVGWCWSVCWLNVRKLWWHW